MDKEVKMSTDCIFCKIANGEIPSETVYEDADFRVILDIAPGVKGHALILPKKHAADLFSMDEETLSKVFPLAKKVAKAVVHATGAKGCNIVQNNGEVAGQTVAHFHTHIIPRFGKEGNIVNWTPGTYEEGEMHALGEKIKKECHG